jgi:hypothetical protein
MKRQAMGHTKMKKLCRRLGVKTYVAVGIMESLWHLTAREAPLGDIGKLSNEDIAIGIDYDGDPDVLIETLVSVGWLDNSYDVSRLVVHDWHEHADDSTKKAVSRRSLKFAVAVKKSPDKSGQVRTNPEINRLPEPVPEPEPVPVPDAVPEAVATKPQQQQQPAKKKPETPQEPPSALDPSRNLDRSEMAHQLVAELAPKHPNLGNVPYARAAVEKILANAVDPVAVCEAARKNHAAAVEYWREFKPKFIPNLWRWFSEEDYMYAPNRAAPVNGGGNYFDERLEKALKREEKERQDIEAKHGK